MTTEELLIANSNIVMLRQYYEKTMKKYKTKNNY